MWAKEYQYLIFLFSLSFLVIIVMVIFLINYIQKKRIDHLLEKERARAEYEEELLKTKVEITEQNMRNIGQELHDNIGQLLSVASLEVKMILMDESKDKTDLNEVSELISQSIDALRTLSKSLNTEAIMEFGLEKSLVNELERLERIGILSTKLSFQEDLKISDNKAMLLFRISQEFISNTLKHAKAKKLSISVKEVDRELVLFLKDDGIGFDPQKVGPNNGLLNIKARTKLLNGYMHFESNVNKGTCLQLNIPNA